MAVLTLQKNRNTTIMDIALEENINQSFIAKFHLYQVFIQEMADD